ncbi:uncharacterized protein LAESUDRAFT_737029 [Laetiporus sulphureus 93-53]|uniref:Uncharacterized protein n=1 Tax=Laetiporus sulphureus 93-53 TaxID=1314785 RepID=A0A165E623_9APHY|nr:uncharacterized protein LAESUDRAFT_737029 [Laetiporus sulphureus 93-53]KZT06306.1 hypothetical protein LAESUDRAFT_737029 [Laetiporus sulphureus 93-53]
MRPTLEQIAGYIPFTSKLWLFWERVTLSWITTIYFIFSILHFSVQLGLQSQAFVINAQAAHFLTELIDLGNATQSGFTVYDGSLHMCESAPMSISASSCETLWDPDSDSASNSTDLSMAGNTSSLLSSALSSTATSAVLVSSVVASSPTLSSSVISSISSVHSSTSLSTGTQVTPSKPSSSSKLSVTTSISEVADVHTLTRTMTVTVKPTATETVAEPDSNGDKDFVQDADGDTDTGQALTTYMQHLTRRGFPAIQIMKKHDKEPEAVLNGDGFDNVTLDYTCLTVLNWPVSQLDNTKREDIAFIMFQFWLLGMSLVALLNESIPHIIASLLTHIGATAWGGIQIYDTAQFHDDFTTLTTNGACGANLLPTYWQARSDAEIPSLVLNAAALVLSSVLSWRLIKAFGWQTFKRVGASRTINRLYNIVLLLSISIQVALFFIALMAGLWLDQLINGYIGRLTKDPAPFKAVDIIVLIGWISVRREHKKAMTAFLFLAVVYLAAWASMFIAPTFRWTFTQWRFFSVMASASLVISLVTLILGVCCRVNFGKGLPRYLNAQEPISDDDFLPTAVETKGSEDVEKAHFPSDGLPIPTYLVSAAPPSPLASPVDPQFAPRRLGPRFFNPSLQPFEPQPDTPPVYGTRLDASALSSRTAVSDTRSFKRPESVMSDDSSTQSKRWVIE